MRTQPRPSSASVANGNISTATSKRQNTRRCWCLLARVMIDLSTFGKPLSQQPRWSEYQNGNQHEEGEHILILAAKKAASQIADVTRAQTLDQTQQQPAQHRATQITYPAQHRCGRSEEHT